MGKNEQMRNRALAAALIAFALGILFVAALMMSSALPAKDLTSYWAAAHLVRQNPYSPHLITLLEKSSGVTPLDPPLVMRNPPWAILFVLPLGMFSFHVAFALWTVFSILIVTGCTRAIWQLVEKHDSIFSIVLPLAFGPTIVLLILGQWSVLVLVGITGFLIAIEHRRDWIAGACLLLVMGKPHIELLFLLAIGFWILQSKRWAVFYSAAVSLGLSSAVVLALNPHVFAQFLSLTREVVGERVPYPNLGGLLFLSTGNHTLALLPQVMGMIWLVYYWIQRRKSWNWKTDGMLVLVVSIASSYYSYPYDEILVLPALATAFLTGNRKVFLVLFVVTNLGYLLYLSQVAGKFGFDYMFLSWTASGWLITYMASRWSARPQELLTEAS
jgi:hypothetical protein